MTSLAATFPTETLTEPDGRASELFDLPHDEDNLFRLFKLLFEQYAAEITFGPCIQGAVFEIHVDKPAELTMLDGYLTVDLGIVAFPPVHRGTPGHKGEPMPSGLGKSPPGEACFPLSDLGPLLPSGQLGACVCGMDTASR